MPDGPNDRVDHLSALKSRLHHISPSPSRQGLLTQVASLITEAFMALGVSPPVVVGGLAVETYTTAEYTTRDVDFIHTDDSAVARVMHALGFTKRPGHRYYVHPQVDVYVEFPTGPLDGDSTRISEIQLDDGSLIFVIGIEDIIIDRLSAWQNWDKLREDSEDAIQAITLLVAQAGSIDHDYLKAVAAERGLSDALSEIQQRVNALRG